ncbi:MAG: ribosome-associated translation inhibitor RaiA [bacterium]|nr:ribosome-associated translation inhibitor RaiA [bacterium]
MQITIKSKNVELNGQLESFINKKIGGVAKFLKAFEGHSLPVAGGRNLFDTFVEVERETMHHKKGDIFKAEAKIYLPGKSLFAKAHGDNLIKAVDEVRDELEAEIRKYKTKVIEFPRRKQKQQKQGF